MISVDKSIRYSQKRPNGETMISGRNWKWFQPNNHRTGDCVVRSLCKYLDLDWLSTFDRLVPIARERQENLGNLLQYADGDVSELGLCWTPISVAKGEKRITVDQFAKRNPTGRFILRVANHVVAVKDGWYWDIWDCGDYTVYGYWTDEGATADISTRGQKRLVRII